MRNKAIILGAGSYVLGDQLGNGVVYPSLVQMVKEGLVDKITFAVKKERQAGFWDAISRYNKLLSCDVKPFVHVFQELSDLNAILDSETFVIIAVPDKDHFEYTRYFITNNVPAWVVKPLTGDHDQSLVLNELVKKHQVPIWVDYHKRFDPSNRLMKQWVDSSKLGDLLAYSVQYSQPALLPLNDLRNWAREIDVFQYIGCHYVDQIYFLFPEANLKRISCTGIEGLLKKKGGPQFDIVHAIIDFELPSGITLRGDFNIAWNDPDKSPSKSHQRVDLQFERGRIIADQKVRGFQLWTNDRYDEVNPYFFQIHQNEDLLSNEPFGYGFESLKRFVEACQSNLKLEHLSKGTLLPWSWNVAKADSVISLAKESLSKAGAWITA